MQKYLTASLVVLSALSLSACAKDIPSWTDPENTRIEVAADTFTDTFAAGAIDKATAQAIGERYYRYGNGTVNVDVTYDPKSRTNTALKAGREAARVAALLKTYGLRDIKAQGLPQAGIDKKSDVIISFPALTAAAPSKCQGRMMPGLQGSTSAGNPRNADDNETGYIYGCSLSSYMAQQVARPGDLLGREGYETLTDGQRMEGVISGRGYSGEKEFPEMKGMNSTGESD